MKSADRKRGVKMAEKLKELVRQIVKHSGGRIEEVKNEQDSSTDPCKDAQEFLKLDGKRLGRDLKLYDFMAEVATEPMALCHILEEILLPIKYAGGLELAHKEGCVVLKKWGTDIFDGKRAEQWKELF